MGARIDLPVAETAIDALGALFGEAPSRVVVSAPAGNASRIEQMAQAAGVAMVRVGETGGDALVVHAAPLGSFSVRIADIRVRRESCLAGIVGSGTAGP
jgi:hypothetical protein